MDTCWTSPVILYIEGQKFHLAYNGVTDNLKKLKWPRLSLTLSGSKISTMCWFASEQIFCLIEVGTSIFIWHQLLPWRRWRPQKKSNTSWICVQLLGRSYTTTYISEPLYIYNQLDSLLKKHFHFHIIEFPQYIYEAFMAVPESAGSQVLLQRWQCLPFSWTTLRGKHCQRPIAVMGFAHAFKQPMKIEELRIKTKEHRRESWTLIKSSSQFALSTPDFKM